MSLVNVTLQDAMGRQTRMKIEVEGADANAEAVAGASILTALKATSKAKQVKAELLVPLTVQPGDADVGSNVDVNGKMRGVSDDDGKTIIVRIPMPKDACVQVDGGLDYTEVNLAAYLALFETGGVAFVSDGEQVDSWRFGALETR